MLGCLGLMERMGDLTMSHAKDNRPDSPCGAHEASQPSVPRRAYVAPAIRALGSVRELTLGATGTRADITGGRRR